MCLLLISIVRELSLILVNFHHSLTLVNNWISNFLISHHSSKTFLNSSDFILFRFISQGPVYCLVLLLTCKTFQIIAAYYLWLFLSFIFKYLITLFRYLNMITVLFSVRTLFTISFHFLKKLKKSSTSKAWYVLIFLRS